VLSPDPSHLDTHRERVRDSRPVRHGIDIVRAFIAAAGRTPFEDSSRVAARLSRILPRSRLAQAGIIEAKEESSCSR
jgi:hypothetical protein